MQSMDEWLTREGGLANRMYRLRRGAGVSGRQIAREAGWGPPKVSKLERGHQLPSRDDLLTWARICRADDQTIADLLASLDEALSVHGQFRQRMRLGQAAIQRTNDDLARAATVIRNAEVVTVPGLLQVPGYARARLAENVRLHGADPAELEEALAARLQRQQILHDTSKRFEFVLTEACLRLMWCDRDAMLAQLDRLLTLVAPSMPHVQLLILPFGTPLPANPQHGFILYDDLAAVETVTGETMFEGEEAATYGSLMDQLAAEAVTGTGARHLIEAAISATAQGA